jgi:hypothetical protein
VQFVKKYGVLLLGLTLLFGGACYRYGPDVVAVIHPADNVASGLEIVVVEADSPNRSQAVEAIYASPEVRAVGKACQSFHWITAGVSGPNLSEVQWALTLAKGKQLPVICFRRTTGKLSQAVALPTTPTATVALIHKYGG